MMFCGALLRARVLVCSRDAALVSSACYSAAETRSCSAAKTKRTDDACTRLALQQKRCSCVLRRNLLPTRGAPAARMLAESSAEEKQLLCAQRLARQQRPEEVIVTRARVLLFSRSAAPAGSGRVFCPPEVRHQVGSSQKALQKKSISCVLSVLLCSRDQKK